MREYGTIIEVDSGDKVVTKYLNHNPDMVILDIHMPGKSGLNVAEELLDVDPDAYVIVFSADSKAQNVLTAMERGANGFLSKPPQKEKIDAYVKRCMTMS